MSESALQIRGLAKHFGQSQVLHGIDIDVAPRSICGFLGPNGAGKSTTMKILMGLLRPSDGEAWVFGRNIGDDGPAARALIGYLPQHPRFPPHQTCREVLEYVLWLHPGRSARVGRKRRIDDLLGAVGLTALADRRTGNLSGGETQRLGIAQALVADPSLLVLDEPAAALDPEGRRDVLDLLGGLRGRTTVFYSTHILDDVQRVSDSALIISGGRIVSQGSIDDLLATEHSMWTVRVQGEVDAARNRLAAEPWVADIDARQRGSSGVWTVHVTDDDIARDRLVSVLLAQRGCDVTEFHPSDRTLEDAYLSIVGHDHAT